MTIKLKKPRNIASRSMSEALTKMKPVLRSDFEMEVFAARAAPFPAKMPSIVSRVMNVDQTRPGWIGARYGR